MTESNRDTLNADERAKRERCDRIVTKFQNCPESVLTISSIEDMTDFDVSSKTMRNYFKFIREEHDDVTVEKKSGVWLIFGAGTSTDDHTVESDTHSEHLPEKYDKFPIFAMLLIFENELNNMKKNIYGTVTAKSIIGLTGIPIVSAVILIMHSQLPFLMIYADYMLLGLIFYSASTLLSGVLYLNSNASSAALSN